ncbi:helix-turn-helix domain-containing protein [Winogradskyella sediminis]|uniref:TolB amino-terminal domain-containing protein n=1 Tax=Winogradskyella sediminis TaxID=1382466 RepID=A0A1H1RSM1_9FLAO|nr:helix-turn-helix domain-containing protein [Winogradskyella sediminis]SDS38546.1 TolB amino-terminal domain-containing protein [Winogradskyella sediminis]
MINEKSIAVLPFVNMSNDIDNESFCDGITEEIINALSKINGLKVIARRSSFAFKNKNIDVRHIGNQLGVATVLEGSVRKSNNSIRITGQLIDTKYGTQYWSKKFDRELVDIFELEDIVSLAIADEVRNNFGHFEVQDHLIKQPTNNVEAYQLFLKGRSLQLKWTPKSLNQAISYYNQAIDLDKNYAKAYYANLQCYGLLAVWGYMPYQEAMDLAVNNLLIAKEIETALPEYPLSFVGKFLWGEWDFKNAYIHIEKTLDINSNYIDGLEAMTELSIALGFFDKALTYANRLLEVDPLSANNHYTLASIYYYQCKFDKALENVNYALTLNTDLALAHHLKCFCLIWLNKSQQFQYFIQDTTLEEEKNLLFQLINNKDVEVPEQMMTKWLQFQNEETMPVPYDVFILSNSSYIEQGFTRLKEMIEQRRGQVINYRQEPFLQPLHNTKAFSELHKSNLSIEDVNYHQIDEEKPSSIILDAQQTETLKEELRSYFEEDEPFLNPQLSLKFVADVFELNTNKISYVINKAFHLNFNDFVNSYRLNHFKSIAIDPKNSHLTILGLAYDSGFNSKSVFNTYFKKTEGTTPSKWVKSNTK